jgi:hypothetical protein
MKAKKKRYLNERESTAGAYVMSVFLHALLLLIIMALFGQAGGSQAGGSESGRILPIGVVAAPGLPASSAAAETAETTQAPPENAPTESPVKIKATPEEKKPEKKPSEVKTIKPRTIEGAGTNTQNPEKEGVESHGTGGTEANNNNGMGGGGSGKGSGNRVGDGGGSGISPFPRGIFNLSPSLVPDCKKNDADNDSLTFRYDVAYDNKSLSVVFVSASASADPSTIAQTRRVIEINFVSGSLEEGKNYKGFIDCKCGAYPRCDLKNQ